MVQPDLSGGLV